MMRKFELCFDFPDGKQVLIPELLSPNEPDLKLLNQVRAELAQLKSAMLAEANTTEQIEAIAAIAKAEDAARAEDQTNTMEKVKEAAKVSGKWILDLTEKLALKATETVVKSTIEAAVRN